jgi:cysteine-rich repeat protein
MATALAACGDNGGETLSTGDGTQGTTEPGESTTNGPTSSPTSSPTTDPEPTTTNNSGTESDSNTSSPTEADTTAGTDTEATDTEVSASNTDTEPPAECGNGVAEGTEECDDGNQEPGDGCENDCTISDPVCGNGVVEEGEVCDDGDPDDPMCSDDCQTLMEEAVCGDGTTQRGEECDDGNVEDGDGCQADCTITPPECGNGKVEEGEECDDGNDVNGGENDFCKNDCSVFIPPMCQAPAEYIICDTDINLADKADKTNAHKAMGICNDTPANSIQITDWSFNATDNASWQVAKGFGTHTFDHDADPNTPNQLLYSPREGDTFLMISTGVIKAPNNQGIVIENVNSQVNNGPNQNPDLPDTMPAPMFPIDGSDDGNGGTPFQNCDGVNDCSDTLQFQWEEVATGNPNDKLWFTFKTKVPMGTFGYTFDFVFCSAEWPVYVNSSFNDLLVAWQVDPTADDPMADPPVDPYTGNVTFIPDPNDPDAGLPLTITALDPYYDGPGYTLNEPQLAGTGFEQHACSDWFTAKGGVQPGADLTIGFFITDMGDTILATAALLDNFRWDCKGCIPSEVDDCGVQDPQ